VGVELPIAFAVHISLIGPERKYITDLRTDADDTRHERADVVATATIPGELVVHVSHRADQQLLGEELRRAPVQMGIDAILIVGIRIDEVVGEAGDSCPVAGLK
jgi:hypothetical protein